MSTVSATSSSGTSAVKPASSDAAKSKLDYDAFLRLFVAQMKNQDPTKPNDPTQSLAQLASFSNVEQSIKLNSKLDQLVASSTATLAASLIGKGMTSLDGKLAGVVKGIEDGPQGFVAILESGKRLPLAEGYRISAA